MSAYHVIPLPDVDISWEGGFSRNWLKDNCRFAVAYSGISDRVECDKYDSSYELLHHSVINRPKDIRTQAYYLLAHDFLTIVLREMCLNRVINLVG